MKEKWKPHSWKNKVALHQPKYESESNLNAAISRMKKLPPLVFAGEVRHLKKGTCKMFKGFWFFITGR